METAITNFIQALGAATAGEIRADQVTRSVYSTDASLYQVMPYGVFFPKTAADVQIAVELAAKHHVPILPRTAGSSLAGQAVNKALVIDFTKHLNQIIELNVAEKWVRVQAGMVLDHLNAALRPHGLQFGPDPASSNRAAMGGIVGNNSTGSHSILYGMTADHVLGMNVVLSDGSTAEFGPLTFAELAPYQQKKGLEGAIYRAINALVWEPNNQKIIKKGTPRHWRRCGGYNIDRLLPPTAKAEGMHFHPTLPHDGRFNLAKLICGAEGTLAVVTDVTLGLVDVPTKTALAVVHFDNSRAALDAVPAILELNPSAVEMLDQMQLRLCKDAPKYHRMMQQFIIGDPNCVLVTEFYGETEAALAEKLDALEKHVQEQAKGVTAVRKILDDDTKQAVWGVRKGGLGLLMSIRSEYKPVAFIEDSAVPVEHLGDYVDQIEAFCAELGTDIVYYAHASAGCLHIRPLINSKIAEDVEKLPKITAFAADLLGEYGGAYSSEHGEGRARSWYNRIFYGEELYGVYKQIKDIFDPDNILNPGNIVEASPMTEHLRFGAEYETRPIKTYLDFRSDGGFAAAIEMCNGAGICRKTSGTMCPSFMATGEEIDSTRGRANVLRNTLNGRLPHDEFTGPMAYEAMDLCLSCKACKSECSSSVDMAKIKAEWQAHYYDAHGIPLRARIFANIEPISRLASGPLAPLVNWGSGLPLVRQAMAKWVGIGGERGLPEFAKRPFTHWRKARQQPTISEPLGHVILFSDTYHTYSYPDIPIAATEVLEAAGYTVAFTHVTDCGRPALSKGLIPKAKQIAQKVLDELEPLAAQGLPIIFLEPSELSAVTDDYLSLLPEQAEKIGRVAACCLSFEQFMAQLADSGNHRLQFDQQPREVLLHGHCHQKALVGTAASHKLLHMPPNITVREVDSGCCGMAGSFGYEAEHVAISRQIGERKLLPAVRASSPSTLVVAAGVSCRQQIKDGTQRKALHPAQFLRLVSIV
ncbi:MAG: FAD-linked oxidase C-terminal domain-containing protein [Chloroflexota bacterium]